MIRLNDLPTLCGARSMTEKAAAIREKAVSDALAAGVDAGELRELLTKNLFHAEPWLDGSARMIVDRRIARAKEKGR